MSDMRSSFWRSMLLIASMAVIVMATAWLFYDLGTANGQVRCISRCFDCASVDLGRRAAAISTRVQDTARGEPSWMRRWQDGGDR